MKKSIRGKFSVEMKPCPLEADIADTGMNRLLLDKTYEGLLAARGLGQMLSTMTETKGSAGYVALEHVTGTLDGKTGSFDLQHFGLMNRGAPSLTVTVVPDSGTGELAGLSGSVDIEIEDGAHEYVFEYELAD